MLFIVPFITLLLGLYCMTILLSYRMGVFGMVLSQLLIGFYFLMGLAVAIHIYGGYEPEQIIGSQIEAFLANLLVFPFAVFAIWKGRVYRARKESE